MPLTNSPPRAARYPGVGRRQHGSAAWPLFAGLGPVGALDTAPRLARAFCTLVLASWELSSLTDNCGLIASELTANVVWQATLADDKGQGGSIHAEAARDQPDEDRPDHSPPNASGGRTCMDHGKADNIWANLAGVVILGANPSMFWTGRQGAVDGEAPR